MFDVDSKDRVHSKYRRGDSVITRVRRPRSRYSIRYVRSFAIVEGLSAQIRMKKHPGGTIRSGAGQPLQKSIPVLPMHSPSKHNNKL